MSAKLALRIVRETAADSSNVVVPDPPGAGMWETTVNYRQVMLCLQQGDVVGEPTLDEYGNWECTLSRFSAGVNVAVTVAALKEGERWRLYVKRVEKEP